MLLRVFYPQNGELICIDGKSVALNESVIGYVLRPNIHVTHKTPEFSVEYKVNKQGLRGEKTYARRRSNDVIRILLLGDSFTFGQGNSYENIWSASFEKKLREKGYSVEVVNAGVQGYDTLEEVLCLEKIWSQYNPDIVVIAFLPNDLMGNVTGEAHRQKKATVITKDELQQHLHITALTRRLLLSNDYIYSYLYSNMGRADKFSSILSKDIQQKIFNTEDLLDRAFNFCLSKKSVFLVLSIPQQFQVLVKANSFKFENIDVSNIDTLFSQFAKNRFLWISSLDILTKEYCSKKKDLYFRYDGHLSKRGNDILSNFFAEEVSLLLEDFKK